MKLKKKISQIWLSFAEWFQLIGKYLQMICKHSHTLFSKKKLIIRVDNVYLRGNENEGIDKKRRSQQPPSRPAEAVITVFSPISIDAGTGYRSPR